MSRWLDIFIGMFTGETRVYKRGDGHEKTAPLDEAEMAFAHRLLGKTCFSAWLVPFQPSVFDGVVDHVHPAQDAVKDGPSDGMPCGIADYHCQCASKGNACLD